MIPRLSPQTESFIKRYITSFVAWDLVVFFVENEGVADTATGLAERLGRREADVTRALEELAESGILERGQGKDSHVYRYAPPDHMESMVKEFVAALDSRDKRLQILTSFLRMGAR